MTIVREDIEDGILTISMNKPEQRNAMDGEMSEALRDAFERASTNAGIRVIILTGVGKAFSAGGDIGLVTRNIEASKESSQAAAVLQEPANACIAAIENCSKPVISAVNGAAAGLGLVCVLATDLIVTDSSTSFFYAYTRVGLPGDCGITRRLVQRIGLGRALQMALLNEPLDAETAMNWNFANFHADGDQRALELAREKALILADQPTCAVSGIKKAMRITLAPEDHLQFELKCFVEAARHVDALEGVTAVKERRKPNFNRA